jgi:hypothetical protein
MKLKVNVTDIGKPADKIKVNFVNSDTDTLEFIGFPSEGIADVTTIDVDLANIKIKGIKAGKSTITTVCKLVQDAEEKETTNNIIIKVI